MNGTKIGARLAAGAWVATLSMSGGTAFAAEYWLRAQVTTLSLPGGTTVPMWAFARCTDATYATCAAPSVPGPALAVPPGEGLTVNVRNDLPQNISLVINGQAMTPTPVWDDGSSGPRPSLTARVRSFTYEAAGGGGLATYSWPSMKPGTYLYQSGTHPAVQVQMGLYGAATKDAASGQAYAGVPYENQVTLLYSEIDTVLHNAVAGPTPTYGSASGPTSTLDYVPRYFLVNGKPFVQGDAPVATIGVLQRTLLRFINAGLQTHVAMLDAQHMQLVAEDGNPYPWPGNPREAYTAFLPAAKTIDAILTPRPGTTRIAIFDRMLALTNDRAGNGGLTSFLAVVDNGSAPVVTPCSNLTANAGQPYTCQIGATDADGGPLVYSLDAAPQGMTINASTGLISWTPTNAQAGANGVTVRVTDPTARSTTSSFSVTVSAAGSASPPAITSSAPGTATYGVAYTYQVTATDPDGGPLAYSLVTAPAGMAIGSASGLVSWTPARAQVGSQPVRIRVTDTTGLFTEQLYTITVADANYAPTAAADTYLMVQGGTLTVAAPGVLANDSDPDGDTLSALLSTSPVGGGLTLQANGGFTYTPAATLANTTRSFTYAARDPGGLSSAPATATITIQANRPPVAADDTFTVGRRTGLTYTPVVLNVLANDSDPDTAIDAANKVNPATVTIVAQPNFGGTVTVNANGTISYTPARNYRGSENFTYRVRDTRGLQSNTALVRVNVQ
jgi:hypothetical protein